MLKVFDCKDRKPHQCSICGKVEYWNDQWCWCTENANLEDLDDGVIIKLCSKKCKDGFGNDRISNNKTII